MSTFLPAVFGENMLDLFDDLDRDFFRGFGRPERMLYGKNAPRMMKTDVKETETGYELAVDLPGMKKDEVKVELEEASKVLQISGERSREQEEKNDKWHRVERSSGKFLRRFRLPENAKVEEINASMENGVLTVTVPKEPEKKHEWMKEYVHG